MSPSAFHKLLPYGVLVALIAVFACLSDEVMRTNAVMMDEYAHVPAGISYWELGRFSIYRENPPVVQCLAALPVWLTGARMDYSRAGYGPRSETSVGADFLNANTGMNVRFFVRARSVITILAVACGVLIFLWARELYGPSAAAVSAAIWFLDPSILAYSTVVTSDIGAATFGCLATYLFWLFLQDPGGKKALLSGVGLGVALGSKFTLLTLLPVWLLLFALARWARRNRGTIKQVLVRPSRLQALLVGGTGLLVLNALYSFQGTLQPLGSFAFKSRILAGQTTSHVDYPPFGNVFRDTWLAGIPIPLPEDYVLGLDSQKWDEEIGFLKLNGGHLVWGGRWYSPFLTLAHKLPLGTLSLIAASLILGMIRLRRLRLADAVVWITPLFMLAAICTQFGLNWIFRYIVVALPFLFIAAGDFVRLVWRYRAMRLVIAACLALNALDLMRVRPSYLSFGNELVGGPMGAQRLFLGSNFDWGQDLLRLKQWCDAHPNAGPIVVSYYGVVDPSSVGLRIKGLPLDFWCRTEGDSDGERLTSSEEFLWAISSNVLNGLPGGTTLEGGSRAGCRVHSPLLSPENAVARIGYSIYVFRIAAGPTDAARPGVLGGDDLKECCSVDGENDYMLKSP